jgi:shikimate dehydrogenase
MRKFGLIGKNLSHTFSPSYFKKKFEEEHISDATYSTLNIETIDEVVDLFKAGFDGFNVTIPYKQSIIPFLDEVDEIAKDIGAVNCIKRCNEKYIGYNTDAYGFQRSLENSIDVTKIDSALILGNGGAAKAVKFVLTRLNLPFNVVTRSGELTYEMISRKIIEKNHLIINTTPMGMFPDLNTCPILPYQFIGNQHILFDLIYNPEKTLFLKKGEEQGALIKNGYEMLTLQADNSWQIWNQT